MVSKRKSSASDPGPSKKRAKADFKQTKSKVKERETNSIIPEVTTEIVKKKRGRKNSKTIKDVEKNDISTQENLENIEVVKPVVTEPITSSSEGPFWPVPDMAELLRRIENILPPTDQMVYKSRAEKLDWEEVAFGNYSASDCRVMWETITKRIRRYRILKELVDDAKNWISKPWTNFYRGSKNNRHPDLPRRPLSTYMIFYLKKKDKILQENPGLEMTYLSKQIAEMYKKLSPKTKKKYQDMAAKQRKEYEEKIEEFYRAHPEINRNHSKSSIQAAAHDGLPKKPHTPFKLYCEDRMKRSETDSDYDKPVFLEKCKEQWKNMSDKKKVFWINWAFDKEVKYHEEMKKYIAENPDFSAGPIKSVLTKEERTIRERMAGKPEKPPNSAYSLFSRLMLASEDVKNVNPKERMLVIAQQWKSCSDVEKKEYSDRVKHMLEQYKLQYAEYLESLPEDKRQEELQNNQPKRKRMATATVSPSTVIKQKSENTPKKTKKTPVPKNSKKGVEKSDSNKVGGKKNDNLYEGEPEPPPATPYLLFAKTYQSSYPGKTDAQEVWENMTEENRNYHRKALHDLKKVYIESYENFLKGLTPDELKEYSQWKKTVKLASHDVEEATEDETDTDSDENECSSIDDGNINLKTAKVKQEVEIDDSSDSN